jgi:3D-(3,5/4)-trihydroxycyclohexane-1,2-dione acylhydrolase (decyclizing)
VATSALIDRSSAGAEKTVRLTTAQALVRYLGAQFSERDGVQRPLIPSIFGIFGHGNAAGIGQALAAGEGGVRYLQGKNEQAMVHAAIGFAKQHDRLSVLGVTTSIGPGATNLVTGAATATVNRIPVLLLPGDVFASRRQGPVLQALEHPQSFDYSVNDCLRPVSRYFDRIQRPEQLMESLPHAIATLLDPAETGAVTIALCQDVQAEAYDYPLEFFARRVHTVVRQPPAPEALDAAVARIRESRHPLLICGGGVRYSGAQVALRHLSEATGIPIGETLAGRGGGAGSELAAGGLGFIGSPAANTLAAEADLVISVGTRLADTVTGSHSLFADSGVAFININVSHSDAIKLAALPVIADARVALEALSRALENANWHADEEWQTSARRLIARWNAETAAAIHTTQGLSGAAVVDELADFTTPSDLAIFSSSTAIGYAHAFWDHGRSARCDFEYGFSCMGHELPAALGARLAGHGGQVYAVIGDGTYLMGNTSELVTAIQEALAITVIILVNDGFQCIKGFQKNAVGSEFGTQFRMRVPGAVNYEGPVVAVDYAANAAAFGCETAEGASRAELRDALSRAKDATRPFVIVARVTDDQFAIPAGAWWDYGSPETAADPETAERHEQYLRDRAAQRWYLG